ncbi:MAG: branched-chain amino acid ABC transporter permease [Candidatus Rokubacteria bacterium]|nr:branched-chain amino acid ABC transporter permease [Candidatus Rokubacteria bacterium]
MEIYVIILVRGIGVGTILALIAMSYNVVYSSSGILNFAQGNMFVLAGLFGFLLVPADPTYTHWWLLLPAAAATLAAVIAIQGYVTLLPLRSSIEQHSWLITTLAVSVIISATILLAQGSAQPRVPTPFPNFAIFGTRTPAPYAMTVGLAILWYVALRLFYARTLAGLAISAIAQDLDAARAAGIRVRRLQVIAFGISGLIVGSAGFVGAPVIAIANDSGVPYALNGFVAAVVGGLGSNLGALVGGTLVGVAGMYAAYQYGGEFQNAVSLGLLIIVLMVRPQGLFGRPQARRV